jgi:Domain of unknown function (DUF4010)/MgtC family
LKVGKIDDSSKVLQPFSCRNPRLRNRARGDQSKTKCYPGFPSVLAFNELRGHRPECKPNPHISRRLPIALKMAVAIGIGMLAGMEREWSNKDVGIRTFAIVALPGMLASLIGPNVAVAALVGVLLLVAAMNTRSILADHSLEITTSAALMVIYLLGLLVGLGHIFTPVAGAIVMTMLLAWKTELSRFAGGLQPSEIRSAVLLGQIGFVIYPVLPNRYIDPWQLFNPSDAWISVIAIAGIGFVNYVLLRIYSTRGLYFGALFGGLVNSSATVAELGTRLRETGMVNRTATLCLLTTIAMFGRNLILATIFSPPLPECHFGAASCHGPRCRLLGLARPKN